MARIDANRGNAKRVGEHDAGDCGVDSLLALFRLGRKKALVGRKTAERQAGDETLPLELAQIRRLFGMHLLFENFDGVETHFGGHRDAIFDLDDLLLKVPEGVGRDADRIAAI